MTVTVQAFVVLFYCVFFVTLFLLSTPLQMSPFCPQLCPPPHHPCPPPGGHHTDVCHRGSCVCALWLSLHRPSPRAPAPPPAASLPRAPAPVSVPFTSVFCVSDPTHEGERVVPPQGLGAL